VFEGPIYGVGTLLCYQGTKTYPDEYAIIVDTCPIGLSLDENDKAKWYWQYEIHYLKDPRFSFYETERDITLLMEEGKLEVLSKVETN
tara:strand:+ start:334 stop:597 length:264 start_codon:yes stop_codon:yes gene_type:complete